ncbi:MAG TPA: hypothetical protein PKD24_02750 [Pyrinomonadaceae bacterium]|nr:hypothetical protein [Pyrinomonadaceae bacterium]HMP64470.1 hypothetical protein [Pyrinomonadaceae bacterium]
MKRSFVVPISLSVVLLACVLPGVHGQMFRGDNGRTLQIEIVQDPPCPLTLAVQHVDLRPDPDAETILLRLHNGSNKAIRAYVMVSGGNRHPNMHTAIFPAKPFGADAILMRSVWPNSQEHYYFFFDYILYDDGSSCGRNAHARSGQIAKYLETRTEAMMLFEAIAAAYPQGGEIVSAVRNGGGGGFLSFDNPGPPDPGSEVRASKRAYQGIVTQLRQLKEHSTEAQEIAGKIEIEIGKRFQDDVSPREKEN